MDEKIYKTMGSAGASTLAVSVSLQVESPPGFF